MIDLHIDQVTKTFGPTTAVDQVSLTIPSGALFFLLGPSGCGKTTLLRMIAGFILPTSGRILFGDQDMSMVPPYKRDTGMVFQSYALWPHMTVADNVGFGLTVRKVPRDERNRRIGEALELVQMGHLASRKPNQLSGGQQQRVALARALAIRPRCLLLDEPLSNLDAKLRLEMRSEIRKIVKQTGITAVYVTHDQKEALSMADGIAVLRSGKLEQAGTPEALYRHPQSRFVADFIGESNFVAGTVEQVDDVLIHIATPVGKLAARRNERSWTTGTKVLAAFRPEAVTVSETPAPGGNTLAARRVAMTYLGEVAEHIVELPNQQRVKVFELNPLPGLRRSEQCVVNVPAEHVMVVPAE